MTLTRDDIETIEGLIEHRLRMELGPRPDAPVAEGQARGTVWDALRELAEAQARTEKRVEELAWGLGEMRKGLGEMRKGLGDLRKQVGGLSETIGGDIEDIAYIVLHDVLKREFGWKVGVLERSWQRWNGEPEEVNIFGRAEDPGDPGKEIWVVGEAKHNVTLGEVERFVKQLERARSHLSGEIFPVCFCYRARPEVQEAILEYGIRLVFSYGKLV